MHLEDVIESFSLQFNIHSRQIYQSARTPPGVPLVPLGVVSPEGVLLGLVVPGVVVGLVVPGVVSVGLVVPGVVEPGGVEPGVVSVGLVVPGVVEPGVVEPGVVEPGLLSVEPGSVLGEL
jgi:hypothetical protein